jgi:rRNA small subunit pseudouridine methyltransferase Nep1
VRSAAVHASRLTTDDSFLRPDNFADHMVDEKIAISEYSLSASVACGKVRPLPLPPLHPILTSHPQFCCAVEDLFGVL